MVNPTAAYRMICVQLDTVGCLTFLAARFDIGFGNPNVTAAFFAMLSLFVLAGFFISSGRLRWIWLLLAGAIGALVFLTESRGGVVSLASGLAFLGWIHRSHCQRTMSTHPRACVGVVFVLLLLAFAFASRNSRVLRVSDDSIGNRWVIYRSIPAMLHAAPMGWGFGNAADSWHNWFQPLDRSEKYSNLVSTHATWCVEGGWLFTWAYAVSWGLMMSLCVPRKLRVKSFASKLVDSGVPFAVWLAFLVSASTTHIGRHLALWILPVAAGCMAVGARRDGATRCLVPAISLGSIGTALALALGVATNHSPAIHRNGSVVNVGSGSAKEAMVAMERKVDGGVGGKLARSLFAATGNGVVAVESLSDLPRISVQRTWLLGAPADGDSPTEGFHTSEVAWVNPPDAPAAIKLAERLSLEGSRVVVLWGVLRNSSPRRWKSAAFILQLRLLAGVGDFANRLDWLETDD